MRLVDDHVAESLLALEGERFVTMALIEPQRVSELNGNQVTLQSPADLAQMIEARTVRYEPLRELKEQSTELAGQSQRLKRSGELAPHLGFQFLGQISVVKVLLRPVGQFIANLRRQHFRLGWMLRQQPKCFDVEREVLRRSFSP